MQQQRRQLWYLPYFWLPLSYSLASRFTEIKRNRPKPIPLSRTPRNYAYDITLALSCQAVYPLLLGVDKYCLYLYNCFYECRFQKPYPQLSNSPMVLKYQRQVVQIFERRPLGGRRVPLAGAALSAAAVLTVQHLPSNPVDTSSNESRTQTELYSSAEVDKAAQDLAVAILANIPADTKCEGSSCLSSTMNTTKSP